MVFLGDWPKFITSQERIFKINNNNNKKNSLKLNVNNINVICFDALNFFKGKYLFGIFAYIVICSLDFNWHWCDRYRSFYIFFYVYIFIIFKSPRLTGYAVHPVQIFKLLVSSWESCHNKNKLLLLKFNNNYDNYL